jgi:hypothetical protein
LKFADGSRERRHPFREQVDKGRMSKDKFTGEPFEAFGEWSFNGEDKTFVGVLTFDPLDGLELRVMDPAGYRGWLMSSGTRDSAVWAVGRTQAHGLFSLYGGFLRSSPASSNGAAEKIYFFNGGLIGVAEADASKASFASTYSTADLLRVWIDHQLVEPAPDNGPSRTVEIRHTLPENVDIIIDAKRTVTIGWDRDGPTLSIAQSSVEIKSKPWIGIEHSSRSRISELATDLSHVERFISLLSGFEFQPELTEYRRGQNQSATNDTAFSLRARIQNRRQRKHPLPLDLIFTLPKISNRFAELLKRWFVLQRKFPGCLNTFFTVDYSTYTNQRLFALTSVLEALHRALKTSRMTLKKRLRECINTSPVGGEVVGNVEKFIDRVVALRNLEAHRIEGDNNNGSEQARLAAKLKVLIDATLLTHIGIPNDEVATSMKQSREYWFYASNSSWPWNV